MKMCDTGQNAKRLCDLTTNDVLSVYHPGFVGDCHCCCKSRIAYNPAFTDETRRDKACECECTAPKHMIDAECVETVVRLFARTLRKRAGLIEVNAGSSPSVLFEVSERIDKRRRDRRVYIVFLRKEVKLRLSPRELARVSLIAPQTQNVHAAVSSEQRA